MVRYLYRERRYVKNVSPGDVKVYSASGSLLTIPAEIFRKEEDDWGIGYIVEKSQVDMLLDSGVDNWRIFFLAYKGIGRDGTEVWQLLCLDDDRVRLILVGES